MTHDDARIVGNEYAFGKECAAILMALLARRIDGAEADRRMVAAAKRFGVYGAIERQPGCEGSL